MKLLLTSAGIKNPSIHAALVEMLGKPIAEATALAIPTANYGHRNGIYRAFAFLTGQGSETPMCELSWKSLGLLELTALPSMNKDYWLPLVQETDVFLVNGGDPLFLHYWMRQSGLADLLPSWPGVYVSLSAGSMVMTPRIGAYFVNWQQPSGNDDTLGLVDFSIFPHLDHPNLPHNTLAAAERWAADLSNPSYAIDDETAIKVVDNDISVISEGHWHHFPHNPNETAPTS